MPRYAAIDIGSNSIRLLAAEVNPPEPMRILAADRQVVRLGQGVFRDGKLSVAAIDLACDVLTRMTAEFRAHDITAVRAVGTAALRDASNRMDFLNRANEIIGTPVEVISGLEEARLIHLGVQARWPHPKQRILILDIGGGSAELILSENGHFVEAFSRPLGAVRLTEMFLKSDPPDPRELARMQRYIQERLASVVRKFGPHPATRMIATSSTAAAAVCAVNAMRRSQREAADRMVGTAAQIRKLYGDVSTRSQAARAKITGIGPRRAEIVVAGVAVLNETLQALQMPRLYYSTAGVRDGVIADLSHRRVDLERARLDPDQLRVVRALAKRYDMSTSHVRKVAEIAAALFDQLLPLHRLQPERGRILEAAAYLYNIGHFVNEARHHRHSLYLVANSDLPGFAENERLVVANLCRYHRKSMPQASHELFQALGARDRRATMLLAPLLRLAIAMDQSQLQLVHRVEAVIQPTSVEMRLYSDRDLDIEQWHSEQCSAVFQQVYGLPMMVKAKR